MIRVVVAMLHLLCILTTMLNANPTVGIFINYMSRNSSYLICLTLQVVVAMRIFATNKIIKFFSHYASSTWASNYLGITVVTLLCCIQKASGLSILVVNCKGIQSVTASAK